jgi:hypothetical protein
VLPIKGLFTKQAELILSARNKALGYAIVLALLPYCTWLGMIVIALVTLRKGEREGGRILLVTMLVHAGVLLCSLPVYIAISNTFILFLPVYVMAYVLRAWANWQAVATVLFLLVIVSSVIIQQMTPEWITSQFTLLQSIVNASQPDQALSKWLNEPSDIPVLVIANYAFGIQLMMAVFSIWSALLMARSLQSRLYYPGGFAKELLTFRGNRMSCIVMVALSIAAWQWNVVAMNVLPILIVFHVLAGLSLCANVMLGKSSKMILAALVLPLIFVPFVVVPLYVILGLLDSVFNIRLAFASKVY